MSVISDLIDRVNDPDLRARLSEEVQTLFIITDSDSDFREMSADFSDKKCYQLYRDYLDNFSINYER